MPTPSTGAITMSQIAAIVYNNAAASVALNDADVRTLAGRESDYVDMNSARGKPVAGNTGSTYYTPGTYTFLVPAYEYLYTVVAGGGGAGGGYCGGQNWFYGCINYCATGNGNGGGWSSFNGVTAYGGGGGLSCNGGAGAAGGNNINGATGSGGAGGAGSTNPGDTNCNQTGGSPGGAGGAIAYQWKKAGTGPAGTAGAGPVYKAAITVYTGAGGTNPGGGCRPLPGSPGGNGYVYISWS